VPDSGMPVPQFENHVCIRLRAGSRFKRFLCFDLINERCFRVSPAVRSPQIEATILDNLITDGDEIVRLTIRPRFTPRKIHGTHLC
jgi:hypothetical protein